MPFTISHAAAVLPIRSTYLPASALVIGAMIPDLPLYVPLPIGVGFTHGIEAALTVNMLLGFVVFVIWHGFFARPADWFAPSAIRRRLSPQQQPGLRRRLGSPAMVAGVFAGLLIGQMTHLFFDMFTHSGTVVTANLAFFNDQIAGLPVYFWTQVGLSIVGLAVMALWAVRWFQSAGEYSLSREPSRLGKIAARGAVLGGAGVALVLAGMAASGSSTTSAVVHMLIAGVVAAGAASVVVAGVWHLRHS